MWTMNFCRFGLLLLLACVMPQGAWAQDSTTSLSAPTCGLTCIVTAIVQNSTCEVTDTTCICTSVALNEAAAACIATSCNVRDQLATQRYSKTTCGVEGRDRTQEVWIVAITLGALGLFAFGLRVMSRVFIGTNSWGPDDWLMTAAVAMMVPLAILSIPLAEAGLGKDIWNLDPDQITRILYIYFWDELIYLAALPLTKISILLFYLKIFPKREIKIAVWVLIGLNIGYLIAFEVISIWQCTPIQGAWLHWDGEYETTCRDINMQGWMAAGLNLVLDLAVLILPLPELARLSMSLRKKLQILAMFCVGFFVSIVSLLRLRSLASYASTSNFTQDYVDVGVWSTIEVPVGVICASMPAIRALCAAVFPKAFGTTNRKRSEYKGLSDPASSSGLGGSKGGTGQWSKRSRLGGKKQQIKVQTEWTVRSHNLQDDNISEVELVPVKKKGSKDGDDARLDDMNVVTTRPLSKLANVETTCQHARKDED